MEELLKQKNLRATPHRLRIARRVLERHCHFTVEEIQAWSANLKRPLSRATVYNILNEFVAVGLLQSFYSDELGRTIYDSNIESHFHLYDLDHREVIDVEPRQVDVRFKGIKDYVIVDYQVLLKGRRRRPT